MDVYCPTCSEPWEMDSIHDEVEQRFPNKPWYVDTKPERYEEPDTINNWCDYRAGDFFCAQKESNPIHLVQQSDVENSHTFHAHVSKSYKTWNTSPFINKDNGLWYDERIYSGHYEPIRAEFQRVGCAAFGMPHNNTRSNPVIGAIYDMMGDDMDGAASAFEDAERMGLMDG